MLPVYHSIGSMTCLLDIQVIETLVNQSTPHLNFHNLLTHARIHNDLYQGLLTFRLLFSSSKWFWICDSLLPTFAVVSPKTISPKILSGIIHAFATADFSGWSRWQHHLRPSCRCSCCILSFHHTLGLLSKTPCNHPEISGYLKYFTELRYAWYMRKGHPPQALQVHLLLDHLLSVVWFL